MTTAVTTLATGRRTLQLEAGALTRTADRLDRSFEAAVDLLASTEGRVIVSGVGKSGIVARKIAATLTSTGSPAVWLHPVDSVHGDLGLVSGRDVAILISKSGETQELAALITALSRMQVPIIGLTGDPSSALGRAASVVLDASVTEEACPLDLAPTTSTAVAMGLGDALAMALLERRGFTTADFAVLHPGGSLGRRLLRVRDVMLPPGGVLGAAASMREVVEALAHHRGLAIVVEDDRVTGVLTAGDLTRVAERHSDYLGLPAGSLMTTTPRLAAAEALAAAITGEMERAGIMSMPVCEADGTLVGVVHLHDLMRAGAL